MSSQSQDHLSRIVIKGYKSIKNCDLELKNINVLIGVNGAGKSNFISTFELLRSIIQRNLAMYAGKKGANSLFYNGTKVTSNIQMEFWFNKACYSFGLERTEDSSLIFNDERLDDGVNSASFNGHRESAWGRDTVFFENDICRILFSSHRRTYHFHDTSTTSKIKMEHNISNAKALSLDASNLAAFLYMLRQFYPVEYSDILHAIRMVAPYFDDFELAPEKYNDELIILRWRQKDCDDIFNASQLSDGTLRFICLATLLLQPTELQPTTIIIDEPELGIHPFAIVILAELVKKAGISKQIILATQSVELLNQFDVDDVVVVDRDQDGSKFKRLNSDELAIWLEDDYQLGTLWKMNILGGRFVE